MDTRNSLMRDQSQYETRVIIEDRTLTDCGGSPHLMGPVRRTWTISYPEIVGARYAGQRL